MRQSSSSANKTFVCKSSKGGQVVCTPSVPSQSRQRTLPPPQACHKSSSKVEEKKFQFPGDSCPEVPDFLILGGGTTGATAAYYLSEQGYRVIVIEAGFDQTDNAQVQQPFVGGEYQDTGIIQTNAFNVLMDPDISSFMGNPSGPGDAWKATFAWDGRGIGGGGLHWYMDYVRPSPMVMDGINLAGDLPAGLIPPSFVPNYVSTGSLRQAGGPAWSSSVLNPIIKNFEGFSGVSECPSFRGTTGPIETLQIFPAYPATSPPPEQIAVASALGAAALITPTLAYPAACPVVEDYNCASNVNSVSQLQFMLKYVPSLGTVVRTNAATAWANHDIITPTSDNILIGTNGRKLIYLTNRTAIRSIKDDNKSIQYGKYVAKGVEYTDHNTTYFLRAKNIISSMGACYTPLFWQRSGIADAALLAKVGIPMQVNQPHMGYNLTNHYGPRMVISTTTPSYSYSFYGQSFVQQNGIPRRFQTIHIGTGGAYGSITGGAGYPAQPAITRISATIGLPSSSIPVSSTATYPLSGQLIIGSQTLSYTSKTATTFEGVTGGSGTLNAGTTVESVPIYYFFFDVFMLHPRSRGYVKITQADHGEQTDLSWGFYNDGPDPKDPASGLGDNDSDIEVSCQAMDYLYATAKEMQLNDPGSFFNIVAPSLEILDIEDDLSRHQQMVPFMTMNLTPASHQSSTCVMSQDSSKGCVDGTCKLYGTENCFSICSSITPVLNSGNTGAFEMAVAINASNIMPTVAML
jgi:choline dehydrogenase-like flavoprotein